MRSIALLVAAAGMLAGSALAQPGERRGVADLDGDGVITREELRTLHERMADRRFDALDADGDGRVTQEELQAVRGERRFRRGPGFGGFGGFGGSIDTDGDGSWSLPELQAVRPEFDAERFNRLDTNGNGLIEPDEQPHRRMHRRR